MLACLIGYFGDFDLAEEATAEAFAVAAQRWPGAGMPDNPGAWLVTTARHRAIDRLRRDRVLAAKLPLLAQPPEEAEDVMDGPPIPDERLELVFMCCHPALAIDAQVALTLRAVAGLTTEEIARAFLVPAETMKRRLTRAKSKIKVAGIPFGVPVASQLPERLAAVLAVVYLIFNEGYSGTGQPAESLASEAIRLGRVLAALLPAEPEVLGLLALMLLHDARREARFDGQDLVLLPDQDQSRWDWRQITEARDLLARARSGSALLDPALQQAPTARGAYALQAAVASLQAETPLDWPQVAALYGELADRTGSERGPAEPGRGDRRSRRPGCRPGHRGRPGPARIPVLALDPGRTPPPSRPRRRSQGRLPRGARAGPHRPRTPFPRTPDRRNLRAASCPLRGHPLVVPVTLQPSLSPKPALPPKEESMALPVRPTRVAPAPGGTTTPRASWLMLAVLLLGQFMCIIDVLVTNVAMPSIAASLHASGASLQLVVGGYTIAYAMLLITGARLGDRYGRRRTYLAGVLVFTTASLACALAPDSQALIGFRLVQGAGAAVLVPQVFSIIQLNFTGPARARALSAYAAVLSAGAVTGLVLGGVVVTADLFGTGWRPVFAINVPIGIVLAAAVPRLVPPDAPVGRTKKLDLAGLGAAACAVLLIVLPLVLGREEGWPAWGFGCIAVGVVLTVGFVLIERRVAARGGDPLLNLAVLHAPALPSGLVTLAATQIGYGGLLFAYTLHLQAGLGESALRSGLSYLPFAAVFGLAGYNWRRLPAAARRVLVPAGLTVGILAYLALAAGLHAGITALTWTGLAAVGLGLGLSVSPLLTQSLTYVPAARAADASGLLTTTVQLGQLLGVAAIGSVYLSRAGSASAPASAPGPGSGAGHVASAAATSAAAMSGTALWLAALSAAGLLAAAVMVRAAQGRRSAEP